MSKKYFTVNCLIIGLLLSLTAITNAQKTGSVVQKYIGISSLPAGQQQKFFSELTNEDKATLFRFHLAFQLTKRSLLTKQQQDLILEVIQTISPQSYDRTDPELTAKTRQAGQLLEQKAMLLFSRQEAGEIFAALGGNQQDVNLLKQYESLGGYSFADRKVIFRKTSAEDKSALWRIHFAYALAFDTELNGLQRSLILEVSSILTHEVFSILKGTPQWQQQDEINRGLQVKALQLFAKEKATAIFATLGTNTKVPTTNNFEIEGGDCSCCSSCWVSSSCPPLTNTCRSGGCTTKDNGCGFAGWYECNGRCTFDGSY
jgi:hypothetical protein